MTAPANFLKGSSGGQKIIAGKFATTTSGAITGASAGDGWSVVKDGTGIYDITLTDTAGAILAVTATLQEADADQNGRVTVKAVSTSQIDVRTLAADVDADIAGISVHFVIVVAVA